MGIDYNTINKVHGPLKKILDLELSAGNEIVETSENSWPYPNAVMIFFKKPFVSPIQRSLEGVKFRNINDPHYWKAEYIDVKNNIWLGCGFDGPNFDEL